MKAENMDCQTCGACCAAPSPSEGPFVLPISKAEARQLPTRMVARIAPLEVGKRVFTHSLRRHPELNRCNALKGIVGLDCRCEVYPQRPEICRVFPAGSEHCLAARALWGFKP